MSILTGEDLVLGTFVPFQWLNHVKNNWRGATLDDVVPGMIQSNEADDKLYHYIAGSGGASEEVLQETKSADVSPMFNGVILDVKSADVSDPPTSAELDAAFGATPGEGFTGLVQDASSLGSLWLASYSGGWWVVEFIPAA
jgi:hypothetical protein